MATTKAFELAQLSALTDVDASGNVTTNTSQIANTSGDLTFDVTSSIILNSDAGNVYLRDDTVDVGLLSMSNADLYIRSLVSDRSIIFQGYDGTSNISALTLDMANGGRATFNENVVIQGDLTVEGTSVTLNTTDLNVEDKSIALNYHATSDTSTTADGAGITIQDAVDADNNASILWDATYNKFDFSHGVNVNNSTQVRRVAMQSGIDAISNNLLADGSSIFTTDGSGSDFFANDGALGIAARNQVTSNSQIGFFTKSTLRALIHDSGNFTFYDSAGDPGMVWDASEGSDGALLIGGHTDLRAGSVAGRNDAQLSLESTNFHNAIFVANQDTANGYHLIIGKSRGEDVNDVDIVQALDEIGSLVFAAADGTDLRPKVAQISTYVSDGTTPSVNAVSGELRFGTTNQGQDVTNHMVLDKDGKVGIGRLTPETKLHVEIDSNLVYTSTMSGPDSYSPSASDIIQVRNAESGVDDIYAGIWFETGNGSTNTTGTDRPGRIALVVDNDNAYSSNFVFQTRGGTGTLTEKLRISGSGNVDVHNRLGVNIDSDSTAIFRAGWANSGVTRPSTLYSAMIETNSDQDGLGLFTTDNRNVRIIFGSPTNNVGGQIVYNTDTTDPYMKFLTNGSEVMMLQDDKVGLGGTGVAPTSLLELRNDSSPTIKLIDTSNDVEALFYAQNANAHLGTYSDHDFIIDTNSTQSVKISKNKTIYNYNREPDVDPIINFDFINSTKLHPMLSFERRSLASYVNKHGDLSWASDGEPRFEYNADGEPMGLLIEETVDNIFYNPNRPGQWSLVSPHSTSQDQSVLAPDGTYSAPEISVGTGTDPYFYQNGLTLDGTYTFSFWIKALHPNTVGKYFSTRAVNLTSNQVVNRYVPSEWTRYQQTFTTGLVTTAYVGIEVPDSGTDFFKDKFSIWGAQLEKVGFATSTMHDATQFLSRSSVGSYLDENGVVRHAQKNRPRYGYRYDGIKYVPTGLIAEKESTNLWTHSGRPALATTGATSIESCRHPAPDGSMNASKITYSTGGYAYRYYPNHIGGNDRYAYSFYIKHISGIPKFGWGGTGGSQYWTVTFTDPDNPFITESAAGGDTVAQSDHIENIGNGWFRVSVGHKSSGTKGYQEFQWNGAGAASYYVWGVQLEKGANADSGGIPTSYISTSTGHRTRSADVLNAFSARREADLADIFDCQGLVRQQGTIFSEWDTNEPSTGFGGIYEFNTTGTNGIDHRFNAIYLNDNFSMSLGSHAPNTIYKTAVKYDSTSVVDAKAFKNGSYQSADSTHKYPHNFHRISLGRIDLNPAYMLNGHLRKLMVYDTTLSDDNLNALTEAD